MFRTSIATFRQSFSRSLLSDLLVVALLAAMIFGVAVTAQRWTAAYQPLVPIFLDPWHLVSYSFASLFRALIAFFLSLLCTFSLGYWAAHSARAERIILPMLDIAQSIPVLGFLPITVMALISLFPGQSFGLELACILMIFTGQVWNMVFSYYASLKALPSSYHELSANLGLSAWRKLWLVETPFAAHALTWNALMSMAGGWFFLTVCEAFTLRGQKFQLPGLGSYMAKAIELGDQGAIIWGSLAMLGLILALDQLLWRPLLAYTRDFQLDESPLGGSLEPWTKLVLRESRLLRWVQRGWAPLQSLTYFSRQHGPRCRAYGQLPVRIKRLIVCFGKVLLALLLLGLLRSVILSLIDLWRLLRAESWAMWQLIGQATLLSLARVVLCLILASLWTIPFGIWIGISPRRTRFCQTPIQLAASFPAPMLYPLALFVLHKMHISLGFGAAGLMLLGVQWYILFNVMAGAASIAGEWQDSARLIGFSTLTTWRNLLLPAVFPALITGWISAAGGAFNACLVAEYVEAGGESFQTLGLGSLIHDASARGDFSLLTSAMLAMVVIVILINRLIWQRLYAYSVQRFRLEK